MSQRPCGKTRADYTRMISHYKSERCLVKENHKAGDPIRTKKLKRIRQRIKIYKAAVDRYDKHHNTLAEVNDRIKSHFDYSLFHSNVNWAAHKPRKGMKSSDRYLIRKMFCKYNMEQRIPSHYIGIFIGVSTQKVSVYRRDISKLISSDDRIKHLWQRFKKHTIKTSQ